MSDLPRNWTTRADAVAIGLGAIAEALSRIADALENKEPTP